ncbi:hypothetical protein [Bifidobacterium leontopitheci]|uniref:Uncharacterized protein n=1 Tax=Bifidobacterium leontopitheci TaxID=2650774 RepID=A0A6I1GG70_9BIFI|nr:hypothetical protein [Bifidobacterium leontopitheci]KAB7790644.1 hypothetical protein F7D09_0750 [Bifidobacterium leontopitheci]
MPNDSLGTYQQPVHDYTIANEIARRKGPGERTLAVLTRVAERILRENPAWRKYWFDSADECALLFCYLCDGDETIEGGSGFVGLNPQFVMLYQTAHDDAEFELLARKPLKHWMQDYIARSDYGRLLDRLRARLNRDERYETNKLWNWLKTMPSAPSTVDVSVLKQAADQCHVDWPSEEAVARDRDERRKKKHYRNEEGKVRKAKGHGPKLGKKNQFNEWLLVVFTTAKGALQRTSVADLICESCPYLIGDHSQDSRYHMENLDAIRENKYSTMREGTDDPTFKAVMMQMDNLEHLEQYGFVDPGEYLHSAASV